MHPAVAGSRAGGKCQIANILPFVSYKERELERGDGEAGMGMLCSLGCFLLSGASSSLGHC